MSRLRNKDINKDKGIVTRSRSGKCEGRKRILEIHPELEQMIVKLRRRGLSWVRISKTLMDEYGYKMFFALTNDDETVIFDLNENEDKEKAMKMFNSSELINMRKETGIDL